MDEMEKEEIEEIEKIEETEEMEKEETKEIEKIEECNNEWFRILRMMIRSDVMRCDMMWDLCDDLECTIIVDEMSERWICDRSCS